MGGNVRSEYETKVTAARTSKETGSERKYLRHQSTQCIHVEQRNRMTCVQVVSYTGSLLQNMLVIDHFKI